MIATEISVDDGRAFSTIAEVSNTVSRFILPALLAVLSSLCCTSCKREIVVVNQAEIEAIKAEDRKAERAEKFRLQEEARRKTEELAFREHIAEERRKAEEARFAQKKMENERELALQKKALEEEVAAIAASSNVIHMFLADLRSRQGTLQLKLISLPQDIEQSKRDATTLVNILSESRVGIVTNIRYAAGGKAQLQDVQTIFRKPEEVVKIIKDDPSVRDIMTRYDNTLFSHEIEKVSEELAFENNRLKTSFALLRKSRGEYGNRQGEANVSTQVTSADIKKRMSALEDTIKELDMRISEAKNKKYPKGNEEAKERGEDELNRLNEKRNNAVLEHGQMVWLRTMSSNTERQAGAATIGITSNFDLQEKGLRDEYESNVRRAFDNVERTVLHVVTAKQEVLKQELATAQEDLAAIQRILDAHVKGLISQKDMMNLSTKFTDSVTDTLARDTDRLLFSRPNNTTMTPVKESAND
jgi:hypothetical protein